MKDHRLADSKTIQIASQLALLIVMGTTLLVLACSDDQTTAPGDSLPEVADSDVGTPDAAADTELDTTDSEADDVPDLLSDSAEVPDGAGDTAVADVADTGTDDDAAVDSGSDTADTGGGEVVQPLPPLPTQTPLAKPADPLAGSDVESCALYLQERCQAGVRQRCSVYDSTTESWVTSVDPLLHRVLLFDRWRDLYNSPDGQAINRNFVGEVLPGTPESQWGKPERFAGYWGAGDGGIWTGWATVAAILRYSQTGTEAEYQRMEQQVRDMVTMYDVTGIPGYVVRHHFLLLPAGAPNTPEHNLRWEDSFELEHDDRPIVNPESIPNLPAIYTEGLMDADGTVWQGQPMWHGRPSIDQNTGPMTSLPMAWEMLADEALKARMVHHLTCYLKRLQRIEIINLQSNPEILDALMAYFAIGELQLDPGDIDLTQRDRVVGYVHRQINSLNEDTYDTSCPEGIQMEPWRVIDATADTFLADILNLVLDMDAHTERENTIDHFYFPNIRGGDAMHLMHLSSMAYHFTGDDSYREFLFNELIGNLETTRVIHTTAAFDLPKYCKSFYGTQITYGPWWAFLHLLGPSELKTELQQAFHGELWDKLTRHVGNVDFNIMYAGVLPPEVAVDREQALAYALEQLAWMGGNGGLLMGAPNETSWLDEPRRRYSSTPEGILAWTPEGIVAECPTEQETAICSSDLDFMGVTIPNVTGWDTFDCTGGAWECPVGDGQCARKMASGPLPVHLRKYTDYLWQRNPFQLGRPVSIEGQRQYAGSDLSVPYWNARRYGFIVEGEGQVLAWETVGDCD